MTKRISFFFDYVSPYAYLAWMRLSDIESRFDVRFDYMPVLFAALLNAHGNTGPAEIPAKRRWMIGNVLHHASLLGVPLKNPAWHPFNPLLALRISVAAQAAGRGSRRLIDAIFEAVWAKTLHVSDPQTIRNHLTASGFDGEELLELGRSREASLLLRESTGDAVAAGVFGVPSMLLDGTMFWGLSDLVLIESVLAGRSRPPVSQSRKWIREVRPSATRDK